MYVYAISYKKKTNFLLILDSIELELNSVSRNKVKIHTKMQF